MVGRVKALSVLLSPTVTLSVLVIAMVTASAAWAGAQTQKPGAVSVFVFTKTDPSGLIDPNQTRRLDSVDDLKKRLATKKTVRLVDAPDGADLTLEVVARAVKDTDTTRYGFGKTRPAEIQPVVYLELRSGDYSLEMESKDANWRQVARNLAAFVDKWIKQNTAVIEKRRSR